MNRTILAVLALSLAGTIPAHAEPRWQPKFKYTWQANQAWDRQCPSMYDRNWSKNNLSPGCRALLEILQGYRYGDLGYPPIKNRLIGAQRLPAQAQPHNLPSTNLFCTDHEILLWFEEATGQDWNGGSKRIPHLFVRVLAHKSDGHVITRDTVTTDALLRMYDRATMTFTIDHQKFWPCPDGDFLLTSDNPDELGEDEL